MPVVSAGLLLVRRRDDPDASLEVFIAHMGGPFWSRRHEGAWSIPKGELEGDEPALAAAYREFAEEIGVPAPAGDAVELGEFRYGSGKRVIVFGLDAPEFTVDRVVSSTFQIEWPPRSGRHQTFPEIDDARWTDVPEARRLLVAGQRPALDAALRAFG